MKSRISVAWVIALFSLASNLTAAESEINIHLDKRGKSIVPDGTLVCRSEVALDTLQTAMYKNDQKTVDWITAGACYEAGKVMKFDKISDYNSGALLANGLDGRSNTVRYLCRYTYNYALKRYVAAQQSPVPSEDGKG